MIPPPCKAQLRLGIELKTRVFIQQTQDLSWIPSTEKDFKRNKMTNLYRGEKQGRFIIQDNKMEEGKESDQGEK